MNNYFQNSNNYFENMLGETANIRARNKKYFQIIILPEEMPYFKKDGNIKKWEKITNDNLKKYLMLSKDDEDNFEHTPNKTLIFIIKFSKLDKKIIKNKEQYKKFYLNNKKELKISKTKYYEFDNQVILNDYEKFMKKLVHTIKSI